MKFSIIKNILTKIFLTILAISFVIWGIGDILRSSNNDNVVNIGNETISIEEFQSNFAKEMNIFQTAYGTNMPISQLKMLGFDKYVLNKIIDEKLLTIAARDLGLKFPASKISELLKNDPSFKDETGKFDPKKFNSYVSNLKISEHFLEQKINDHYIKQLLINILSKVKIDSQKYAEILMPYQNHSRSVKIYKISQNQLLNSKISDEKLKEFYEKNKILYMNPEKRSYSYVTFNQTNIKDENNIEDLYEKIDEKLSSGESIQEISKSFDLKINNIDFVSKNELLSKNIHSSSEKAFELDESNKYDIVFDQKSGNYVIIFLNQIQSPTPKSFNEVYTDVKHTYETNIINEKVNIISSLTKLIKNQKDAEKISTEYKAEIFDYTINSNNTDSHNIPFAVLKEIFQLDKNNATSLYLDNNKNGYFGLLIDIKLDYNKYSDDELKLLSDQISKQRNLEMIEYYVAYLRNKYTVKVNKELFDIIMENAVSRR